MKLQLYPTDDVLVRLSQSVERLGSGQARVAMARALNHEGRKTFALVKRTLGKQTSAPAAIIASQVRYRQPSQKGDALQAEIRATGSELPLKEFKPRQFKAGTRARVWGRLQSFPGTFMGPRPGVVAAGLRGQVWVRGGADRLPIEVVFGPSLPKEMVKDATAEAFTSSFAGLADRVTHEVGRLLPR